MRSLQVNSHNCVSMGDAVLVVPDGSTLSADGSIEILGTVYTMGSRISLGGGGGTIAAHTAFSKCGVGSDYFWAD